MARTNLGDSFRTVPPVAPISGRAKIIARNTFRYVTTEGATVTRLHLTDVVQAMPGGRFRLDSGGWQTMTTKDRINDALRGSGFVVTSGKGVWHVAAGPSHAYDYGAAVADSVPFFDGMILPDAFTSGRKKAEREGARVERTKAQIKKFVCDAIKPGKPVPVPSGGDCWLCSMMDAEPEARRESSGHNIREARTRNDSHLLEHVREKYMHGSLIVNAFRYAGFADAGISLICFGTRPDHARIRRTVRRYLQARLGVPH